MRSSGRADNEQSRPKPKLRKVLPEIWELIKPRRGLLAFGFVLMVINRVAGLVLPASTKSLVDGVMLKHQAGKLPYIVGAVLLATSAAVSKDIGLLATFVGIGIIVGVISAFIAVQVRGERRQNQEYLERRRHGL